MRPPLPAEGDRWALFLDLDGTLAELVEHPDLSHVPPTRVALLSRLEHCLDGALAVVSGRSIDSIDGLLHPLRPNAAGLHGIEWRRGTQVGRAAGRDTMEPARHALGAFVAERPGLMLEDKGATLALHYRNAPHYEDECREQVMRLVAGTPVHHVIAGKMVFELKPRGTDKGSAVEGFLAAGPFHGRRPVFAGDDVTDEDGFRLVNANDGVSIKIGDGETCARFRLRDVDALHAWLERLAVRLASDGAGP